MRATLGVSFLSSFFLSEVPFLQLRLPHSFPGLLRYLSWNLSRFLHPSLWGGFELIGISDTQPSLQCDCREICGLFGLSVQYWAGTPILSVARSVMGQEGGNWGKNALARAEQGLTVWSLNLTPALCHLGEVTCKTSTACAIGASIKIRSWCSGMCL